jgi:hypothetical protein
MPRARWSWRLKMRSLEATKTAEILSPALARTQTVLGLPI